MLAGARKLKMGKQGPTRNGPDVSASNRSASHVCATRAPLLKLDPLESASQLIRHLEASINLRVQY